MAKANTETQTTATENGNAVALRENLEAATDKVQAATDKLTEEIDRFVSQGMDTIQRVGRDYADKLNVHTAQAGEQAKKMYTEGEEYVRKNPLPSVLGAFAIGLLFGTLLGRD